MLRLPRGYVQLLVSERTIQYESSHDLHYSIGGLGDDYGADYMRLRYSLRVGRRNISLCTSLHNASSLLHKVEQTKLANICGGNMHWFRHHCDGHQPRTGESLGALGR